MLGVLLGVLAGVLVSLLGSSTRRAEASVLISSSAGPAAVTPMLPNLRELATSGVVAANVRSTLRLTRSTQELRRHLHATVRPQSQVIAISATDEVADHARQVAQESAVVFAQLVEARFGTGEPALHAAVLDSAHVLGGGQDRHLARNALIGALVGLLLGSASMFVLASGRRHEDLRKREGLVDQRVKGVTARERALAERAGKLAAREQELDARDQELDARAERATRSSTRAPRRSRPPSAKSGHGQAKSRPSSGSSQTARPRSPRANANWRRSRPPRLHPCRSPYRPR